MIEELPADEIEELLRAQFVGRIGCHADGLTYVVPVIYAYEGDCLYAHTLVGQKVAMMRANPDVCFEVDEYVGGSWRSAGNSACAARTRQARTKRYGYLQLYP